MNMDVWKAIQARVSVFTSAPLLPSVLDLYKAMWNGEPDNLQKSPNRMMPSSAKARRGNLTIGCQLLPQRIDFYIAASPKPSQNRFEGFDLIEDASELRRELLAIVTNIGKMTISDKINRIAFSAQFHSIKSSIAEANKAIVVVIPERYRPQLQTEEEFILQINNVRASNEFKDIRMNYISKWSVERIKVVSVVLPADSMAPTAGPPEGIGATRTHEYLTASVTFDHNNSPTEKEPLSTTQQSSLLLEGFVAAQEAQKTYGLNIKGFESD